VPSESARIVPGLTIREALGCVRVWWWVGPASRDGGCKRSRVVRGSRETRIVAIALSGQVTKRKPPPSKGSPFSASRLLLRDDEILHPVTRRAHPTLNHERLTEEQKLCRVSCGLLRHAEFQSETTAAAGVRPL
jgi:hypothetical protein